MNSRQSSSLARIGFTLWLCLFLFSPAVLSQSPTKEKPRLKDFGSSLKRLKWDSKLNTAVEVKQKGDAKNSAADDVVRVETSLVVSDVLVLDQRGQSVNGLAANDFLVTEDSKPQQVGMFSLGDNATVPRRIVLIMDYGCSQLSFLSTSIAAAKILIEQLGPRDQMAIVTDDIELLSNYTNDKRKLKDALDRLLQRTSLAPKILFDIRKQGAPFGRGFQYSALMAILKEAFDEEDMRPIIIFQTDGSEAYILKNSNDRPSLPSNVPPDLIAELQEGLKHFEQYKLRNKREFSLNDVYRAAESSRATIYTVVPGLRLIGLSASDELSQMRAFNERLMATIRMVTRSREASRKFPDEVLSWQAKDLAYLQSALAVLSTTTGGWIEFLDQPSQAGEIYSRIFSDINRRYLVGYYPTNKEHDGKRRKVKIEVRDHPEYTVMGRKGYYAPLPDR